MARNQWRVSSNGPDWTDLISFMKEIDGLHDVVTNVQIMPWGGKKSNEGLVVIASLSLDAPGLAGSFIYSTEGTWPDHMGRTLEGLVYFLLHKHDAELGRSRWKQSDLWPKPDAPGA